ncbi:MAG: sialidase family protein [Gemmatimonadota bacterium]
MIDLKLLSIGLLTALAVGGVARAGMAPPAAPPATAGTTATPQTATVAALAATAATPQTATTAALATTAATPPTAATAAQAPAVARQFPALSPTADGAVLASWLESTDGGATLRYARWRDNQWSTPATVATGDDWLVNWADFPAVVELPNGRLAAQWLVREAGRGAYSVRLAWSEDGGATWSPPLTPHDDGTATEHGFVSLFPHADATGAVWLDGRAYADSRDGPMTLRWAAFDAQGVPAAAGVVDDRICDCCQTDAAATASGTVVVYRDRSPEEIRDIKLVRLEASRWSEPVVVHEDGWHINACPVNGPAVAAAGDRVAVAWFTAPEGNARSYVAFSEDGGRSFGPPVRIDDGEPVGRVDLLLLADGHALVSWMERAGEGAEVRLRRVAPDGRTGSARSAGTIDPGRASGFPRMARAGDTVLLGWTAPGEPAALRFASVTLPGQ